MVAARRIEWSVFGLDNRGKPLAKHRAGRTANGDKAPRSKLAMVGHPYRRRQNGLQRTGVRRRIDQGVRRLRTPGQEQVEGGVFLKQHERVRRS